jgi:glycosyltransferase involved in cell wall biosynthesis
LGGGSIRQAHLIQTLAEHAQVHLVAPGPIADGETRAAAARITELDWRPPSIPPASLRRTRDAWRSLARRAPGEVLDNAGLRRAMLPLVRAAAADVVCVEHHALAPLLRARRTGRWAVTFHNVPSRTFSQAAAAAEGRQRWLWTREAAKSARLEAWASRAFDVVMAVSDDDAAALPGRQTVVPNGVDVESFVPTPLPAAPALVFTGTLGYLPNHDGLLWFCEAVFPRVRRAVPTATFDIVGRLPRPEVTALGTLPGVRVHTDVPAIQPYLERARVAVVPLRLGSGTRLKALEALAAGRPVVGTSVGLGGLGLRPGVHAEIADDDEAMAAAIVDLLVNGERAERLARAGRALVEDRYRWEVVADRYVAAVLGRDTLP